MGSVRAWAGISRKPSSSSPQVSTPTESRVRIAEDPSCAELRDRTIPTASITAADTLRVPGSNHQLWRYRRATHRLPQKNRGNVSLVGGHCAIPRQRESEVQATPVRCFRWARNRRSAGEDSTDHLTSIPYHLAPLSNSSIRSPASAWFWSLSASRCKSQAANAGGFDDFRGVVPPVPAGPSTG